jgi:hypothetical protein
MMGETHRFFGLWAGIGTSLALHWPPGQILWTGVIAVATAAGGFSPDMDQKSWFKALDRWIPDEWLGHGGPLQHRGLSHFWGVPAVGALAVMTGEVVHPGAYWFIAWALLIGWASHLLGDFIFGKAAPMCGRGKGIPLAPWWSHHGLGLDTDGRIEHVLCWLMALPYRVAMLFIPRRRRRNRRATRTERIYT